MRGVVVRWDDRKGYGAIRADDTGAEHFVHCTQILDGSRTIDEGATVEFEVVPGRLGQWEAVRVTTT